ncbi:MAG: transcription antitermination factor NusB [Ruminococcaceae bacterium]|nr:transcription antitermination factor NusB [Oscillospiraceae bacterium]
MSRRDARDAAIKIIFEYSFSVTDNSPESVEKLIESYMQDFDESEGGAKEEYEYLCNVVRGVISNIDEIDELIKSCIKGWSFERLGKADVAILRVAVYEMKFREDIPESISINEAVELAKKYGTDDSPSYINGVLGSVYKILKD